MFGKRLDKIFQGSVGRPYDKDALSGLALTHGIRLLHVFHRASGNHKIEQSKTYTSKSQTFSIKMRQAYTDRLFSGEMAEFYPRWLEVQQELANRPSLKTEDGDTHNLSEEEILAVMISAMDMTRDALDAMLGKLEAILERENQSISTILDRGFLFPWEHLKYTVVEKTNLPPLPQEKYKGKVLKVDVLDGVVHGVEIKKHTPRYR